MIGTSAYPGLQCGGEIKYLARNGNVLRVQEIITDGRAPGFGFGQGCIDSYLILELLGNGELFYKVVLENNQHAEVQAEGILKRQ